MPIYLTPEGKEKLEKELKILIAQRIEISNRIERAREMGDLKENAEYHDAKDEQGMSEGRIREIQDVLNQSEVVAKNTGSSITLGSKIIAVLNGNVKNYEIVGANEANPLEGRISNESPLGKAFMGREEGNTVEVNVPAGKMVYEIKEVR
ncbi:MAG: transcription elongation factor GreA [bacterium]